MTVTRRQWRDGIGFEVLLMALAIGYLLLLAGVPLVYNMVMSFQDVDAFSLNRMRRDWVGLANYRALLERPEFGRVAINTVVFTVASVGLQFTLGFALALFFDLSFPGARWLRGLFLVAWVMPGLVVGGVWGWILAGDAGVLNHVLQEIGLIGEGIFWRSDTSYSLWSIVIANVWLGVPFNMILLSVGLAAIPDDLHEAAAIDGATPLQGFLTITLPLMRATIAAVLSLGTIFTLQQFDLVAALTSGGPANSSNIAPYWAWQLSFREYDFALGATISGLMLVVVGAVATLYVRSTRDDR